MKTHLKSRIVATAFVTAACLFAADSANAALISWGPSTTIINDTTQIATTGFSVAGVDFSNTTAANVTINNGPSGVGGTNVVFTRLNGGGAANGNASALLSNGITVTSSGWGFANSTPSMSNVTNTAAWGTIMDSNIGLFSGTGVITLSGLTFGTKYQVQYFASAEDGNSFDATSVAGSPVFGAHAAGSGRFVLGTFTADAVSQVLTIATGAGDEPVASALTIGAAISAVSVPEPASIALVSLASACLLRRRRLA